MAALKLSSKEIKLIFRVFEKKRVCVTATIRSRTEFRANAVASIEMAKRAIGGTASGNSTGLGPSLHA